MARQLYIIKKKIRQNVVKKINFQFKYQYQKALVVISIAVRGDIYQAYRKIVFEI